ncbi:uncharacterized protein LOC110408377 [Numida meleagris]|uniref:uncharacterized protein LOC110408377 n=1 Tax=Numida meleagris TaxID=8996 RepID=UPI000B3E0DED|nr:uncharacterized protein LOC110408377 [Numida meleagris]
MATSAFPRQSRGAQDHAGTQNFLPLQPRARNAFRNRASSRGHQHPASRAPDERPPKHAVSSTPSSCSTTGRAPGRGRGREGRGTEPRRVPAGRVPIPAPRGAPRPRAGGSRGPAEPVRERAGGRGRGALARKTEAAGGGGIYPGPARRRRALRLSPERELTPPGYPSAVASRNYIPSWGRRRRRVGARAWISPSKVLPHAFFARASRMDNWSRNESSLNTFESRHELHQDLEQVQQLHCKILFDTRRISLTSSVR